jgi:hypothetical protein
VGEEAIQPHVRAFIAGHVDSVLQLELLLLLAVPAHAAREWSAADLAHELRIDPAWVEGQLKAMGAQGLLDASTGPPPTYRYHPRTAELGQAVSDLAQAYADRRVTVIGLIFAKPTDKLRTFADAFRIRKDPTDG